MNRTSFWRFRACSVQVLEHYSIRTGPGLRQYSTRSLQDVLNQISRNDKSTHSNKNPKKEFSEQTKTLADLLNSNGLDNKSTQSRFNGIANKNAHSIVRNDKKSFKDKSRPTSRANKGSRIIKDKDGVPKLNFEGSFQAVDCMKYLIRKIYVEYNRQGKVNYLSSMKNNIETTDMILLLDRLKLDLNTHGLIIVSVNSVGSTNRYGLVYQTKIPLLKVVDKRTALEKYSKEIGEIKYKEIASRSPKFANILEKKKHSKGANNNTKLVKIGWSISEFDLANTKKNEILTAMSKNKTVVVYFGSKNDVKQNDVLSEIETLSENTDIAKTQTLEDLEILRREKTLAKLNNIIENSDIKHKVVTTGSIYGKMALKISTTQPTKTNQGVSPDSVPASEVTMENLDSQNILEIDLNSITDKKLLKEIRKKQRQEKQRLREEKKKTGNTE